MFDDGKFILLPEKTILETFMKSVSLINNAWVNERELFPNFEVCLLTMTNF